MPAGFDEYSRLSVPTVPVDRRTGITEVESGYTEEQARAEASRCLRCWINTVFDGVEADGNECILCGGCVEVCPQNCLQLVPLRQFALDPQNNRQLSSIAQADPALLHGLTVDELFSGQGSVMVKDETICIRCGLCAERCPAHTITMESFEVFEQNPDTQPVETLAQ